MKVLERGGREAPRRRARVPEGRRARARRSAASSRTRSSASSRSGACTRGIAPSTPPARSASTACARPGSPTSAFEPRDGFDPSYLTNPRVARLHHSPVVARWKLERGARALTDGSAIADVPYKTEEWLLSEVLADRGETIVLEPQRLRDVVAKRARRLQRDTRPRSGARLTVTRLRRIGADMSTKGDFVRSHRYRCRKRQQGGRMDEIHSSHSRLTRAAGMLAGLSPASSRSFSPAQLSRTASCSEPDRPLLEATHLPPLLTTRDERVELRYDVYCARSEADAETPCAVRRHGLRSSGRHGRVPGDRRTRGARCIRTLRGTAAGLDRSHRPPASRTTRCFGASDTGMVRTLPAGGAAAPQRSLPLGRSIGIALGSHEFGNEREAAERVVRRRVGHRCGGSRSRAGQEPHADRRLVIRRRSRRLGSRARRGEQASPSLAEERRNARRRATRHQRDAGGHVDRRGRHDPRPRDDERERGDAAAP